jgi:aminomethyltransferase
MPLQYKGIVEETRAVRERVGVFDVSHMGEFSFTGLTAKETLQQLVTNDLTKLSDGQAQYNAMCYEDGGIVDDLLVYRYREDKWMVVVNASNREKDFEWMRRFLKQGTELRDLSDDYTLISVQGPESASVVSKLTNADIGQLQYYHFVNADFAGVSGTISRTGYTGEDGFELMCAWDCGEMVWDAVFEAGKDCGIVPVGLGARDLLRLEAGYCLYGHEIDQTTNPIEAGLGWITKPEKGEFNGRTAIERVLAEGPKRKLVGLEMLEAGIPRQKYAILADGREVGRVTSGSYSPTMQVSIALGYLPVELAEAGRVVQIDIRGQVRRAKVVSTRFYKRAR